MQQETKPIELTIGIRYVLFGADVKIIHPCNLYGCSIGDNHFACALLRPRAILLVCFSAPLVPNNVRLSVRLVPTHKEVCLSQCRFFESDIYRQIAPNLYILNYPPMGGVGLN
jgi:hypothetical protein